jgi:hypothetical protein
LAISVPACFVLAPLRAPRDAVLPLAQTYGSRQGPCIHTDATIGNEEDSSRPGGHARREIATQLGGPRDRLRYPTCRALPASWEGRPDRPACAVTTNAAPTRSGLAAPAGRPSLTHALRLGAPLPAESTTSLLGVGAIFLWVLPARPLSSSSRSLFQFSLFPAPIIELCPYCRRGARPGRLFLRGQIESVTIDLSCSVDRVIEMSEIYSTVINTGHGTVINTKFIIV